MIRAKLHNDISDDVLVYFLAVDGSNDNIGRHDHLRRLRELLAFSGPELLFAGYAPHCSRDTRVHNSFYGMLRRAPGKHLHGSCGKRHVYLSQQIKRISAALISFLGYISTDKKDILQSISVTLYSFTFNI